MFNAIFVDDEPLAALAFSKAASSEKRLHILQTFTSSNEALSFIMECHRNSTLSVDIIFTDIEMPVMNGISFAEKAQELFPSVEIVFITAYEQYMLQAFKLYASGYLLKPIKPADITSLVDHTEQKRQLLAAKKAAQTAKKLTVQCFGTLQIPMKLRTEKALQLLVLLIKEYGRPIEKTEICTQLWPDFDLEKSVNNFYVTCSYLKKTLFEEGYGEVIVREGNCYSIPTSNLNCDYYAFKKTEAESFIADTATLEHTAALYKTGFCADKTWEFLEDEQNECRASYIKLLYRLADLYTEENNSLKTQEILKSILKTDVFEENAFNKLKKLYALNHNDKALKDLEKSYQKKLDEEY